MITAALSSVREAFGWIYGTFWKLHPEEQVLRFAQDAGSVSEEFRRATAETQFREGEGINGKAWQSRDLVFVPDLSDAKNFLRATAARRAGLKSGIGFPILVGGQVVGTMDFLTDESITPSEGRIDALRNVGRLVSTALERVDQQTRLDQAKKDLEIKVNQLMKVAKAASEGDLTVAVEVKGDDDMGRLGDALSQMISDLKHIISQVIESASQFAEGSRVVAESASYLSDSAQNQAATVEEMSASIQQLSNSIVEINQNVSVASSQATTDLEARQAGRRVGRPGDRGHGLDQEIERAGQRHHPGHQRDRQPDQPPGPERGDRGRPGRRARPGLRRRRRRGPQAGRAPPAPRPRRSPL